MSPSELAASVSSCRDKLRKGHAYAEQYTEICLMAAPALARFVQRVEELARERTLDGLRQQPIWPEELVRLLHEESERDG